MENPYKDTVEPGRPHVVAFEELIDKRWQYPSLKFNPEAGKCAICGSYVETDICIRTIKQ